MFATRYFADRYFAPRYFPKIGAISTATASRLMLMGVGCWLLLLLLH